MTDIEIAKFVPTIKNILENSVRSKITAKEVRIKLEKEFKVDLTSRKHEVQRLVEQCFDDLVSEVSGEEYEVKSEEEEHDRKADKKEIVSGEKHVRKVVKKERNAEERRYKSSTESHKRKSKKLQKPRVKSNVSDCSSLEDEKQKKKRDRKRKGSPVDSDAEFERRFEEELIGKKSKSKNHGISKKKSSSHKRKRKDDDEGNEEKKKRKGTTGIHKPLVLSPVLSEFLNAEELSRLEVVKRLWAYIKENHLQDPNDGRYIVCDEKLTSIFKHERIHSFTMNKYLTDHLKKKEDLVAKVERGNSSSVNEDDHNDHSEEVEIKTEGPDEVQYKSEDDHSEVGDDDDDGVDDAEWAQD